MAGKLLNGWKNMEPEISNVVSAIKVFGLLAASFAAAVLWTPFLTKYLYKYQLWRKEVRTSSPDGTRTPLFAALHKDRETRVPRLGGILIWVTTIVIAALVWVLSEATDIPFLDKANFFSRNQTWLPLAVMLAASLLGLVDDLAQVFGRGGYVAGGIKFRQRLLAVFLIAVIAAWWFYFKLDWRTIYVPGYGDLYIGLWYIPFSSGR